MSGHKESHTRRSKTHRPADPGNLLTATLLNFVITVVEAAGGILSGSLALISVALHNLSNTITTFMAWAAIMVGRRNATPQKTLGYKRLEILTAILNAVILAVVSIFLVLAAWERWQDPRPLRSMIMLVVALIGLLGNLFALVLLKRDSGRDADIRTAYAHLVGDSLSSVVVIIGGVLIQLYGYYWIDPLITVLISVYLVREAFVILKGSVRILLRPVPVHLDSSRINRRAERIPGVKKIHHLHTWMRTEKEIHLEARVELNEDLRLSQVTSTRRSLEKMLAEDFEIRHVTLQFEYGPDPDTDLFQAEGD